jgi:hypothetical protein
MRQANARNNVLSKGGAPAAFVTDQINQEADASLKQQEDFLDRRDRQQAVTDRMNAPPAAFGGYPGAGGGSGGGGGGGRHMSRGGGGDGSFSFAPAAFGDGSRYNAEGRRPDGRKKIEGGVSREGKGLNDFYAMQGMGIGNQEDRNARVDGMLDKGVSAGFGGQDLMKNGKPLLRDEFGTMEPVAGFANGVTGLPVAALDGQWFNVGEQGPEKMKIDPNGTMTVVPNHELQPAAGWAGGAVTPDGSGPPSPVSTGQVAAFGGPPADQQFSDTRADANPRGRAPISFGEAAAAYGSGGAGDVSGLPNLDGRPNGVDKRTWKQVSRTPGFATMAWQEQNADRRYDKRENGAKNEKQQQEADTVAGLSAAMEVAYPAAFTPEVKGALSRMKPSVAAGFLTGVAGHFAQSERDRPASAPTDVPEGYDVRPSDFTPDGKPKKYELVKRATEKEPKPWAYEVPGMPGTKVFGVNNSPLGSRDMTPKTGPTVDDILAKYPQARITHNSDGTLSYTVEPKVEKPGKTPMMKFDERGNPSGIIEIPDTHEYDPKSKRLVPKAPARETGKPMRTSGTGLFGKK